MYKIAVCDDNKDLLHIITAKIQQYCKKCGIMVEIAEFWDCELLLEYIESQRLYDVYLLDIEMPHHTGIEIARTIREYSCMPYIIFLTAYDKYAVEACHMDIFWYLCKEKLDDEMAVALDKLFSHMSRQEDNRIYVISNKRKYVKFYYRDIIYVQKNQKNVEFILTGGKNIQERITLQDVYQKLGSEMILLDRGTILNLFHIQSIESNEIRMDEGHRIAVNPIRIPEVKRALSKYWGSNI
mgnify:FL=1